MTLEEKKIEITKKQLEKAFKMAANIYADHLILFETLCSELGLVNDSKPRECSKPREFNTWGSGVKFEDILKPACEGERQVTYGEKREWLASISNNRLSEKWVNASDKFLIEELEKAWPALEIYADKTNYILVERDGFDERYSDIQLEGGERARKALEE
jgi:hypothetical protein